MSQSKGTANKSAPKGKSSIIEKLKAEISAQTEGQEEVIELNFEDIAIEKFTPEINNLLKDYPLKGFPKIQGMVKLCFEQNKLGDDSINYITENFKDLQFLSLSNNKISKLETLKSLSKLGELQQLDLQENPASELAGYRELLFKNCPKLEILDNKDKDGQSVKYSDDEDDDDEDIDDTDEFDDEDLDDEDEEDDDDDDDDEDNGPIKKKR